MADSGRRPLAGSLGAKLSAFAAVGIGDPEPPKPAGLRKKHLPYWLKIVRARPRADWSDIDLMHAATLATLFCGIDEVARKIHRTGATIKVRDQIVANPLLHDLEKLTQQTIRLCRFIHVHASVLSTAGSRATDKVEQVEAERAAREFAEAGGTIEDPHGLLQ